MIKSIQLREGSLHLAISCPRASASGKCKCRIQFDFGERRAVTECHSRELMNLVKPIDFVGAHEIRNMILKLLCAEPRISWVDLHGLNSPGVRLENAAAPDVLVEFTSGAAERTGG